MSLVELLTVLGILSIVLVLAIPRARAPAGTVELRTIAHDLVSRLGTARAAAIGRGRAVAVNFDVGQLWYRVETEPTPVRLPNDLTMALTTARELTRGGGSAQMLFFPDGSSTGGRVVLRRQRFSAAVGVDWLTGLARVEDAP